MSDSDEKPWKQWPMPIEEAAAEVLSHMPEEAKKTVANSPKSALHSFHLNMGMWVRNKLGLWSWSRAVGPTTEHPDGPSMRIIEAVWEALQEDGRYKGVLRDPDTGKELPEELRSADFVQYWDAIHPMKKESAAQ